ncbi:hypothetical protein CIL05_07735 [Virgibacillus profundi]|uniref:Uncharacterized protein n=1 Tax=Virgibacillus profundi TaxID=2024555 RepID=A0A2A2IGY5_9BACI|nr:hypothetical protein [Virgibacillus profundi]PAV30353.1 hypothetical protein CIL05_07735 [Virgibacillus profundi]PXY54525.1 hypothetical protein CIT14_07820 [Virgibacillus profundi]
MYTYICDLCGGSPSAKDRYALIFNDGKDKAQIRGHKDCIDQIEAQFAKVRQKIKKKSKGKTEKIVSVKEQFAAMEMELEDYRVEM